MRVVRLSFVLAALAVTGVAHASSGGLAAPKGLHGFLLRADEPAAAAFDRTPSFAWAPVAGALRYEFQLSVSSAFSDNGVLYDDSTLVTPVAAPPLTLPWITGSPHALYARVRALFAAGASPWSAAFGFDVTPPPPPTPLPSYPGVLRWTATDGADAYQVWMLDAHKTETVRTNVLDEREYYTFHRSQQWIGTVHWRVRALRDDTFDHRINGMPAAQYGAWSPTYTSTNPALADGPIRLVGTVSDTFSDGSASSPAHALMPAFVWTGDETASGTPAQLFRVYAFTDRSCLNRVYTSAVVGSPAYAPRLDGPLALPAKTQDVPLASASYLGDGPETSDLTYDGESIAPNEQLPPATPTVAVSGDLPAAAGTTAPVASGGSAASADDSGASGATAGAGSGSGAAAPAASASGPPVDLWDVDWPSSGYYWTVVPVEADGASATLVVDPGAAATDTVVPVDSTAGFATGDHVTIGTAPNTDSGTVVSVGTTSITLSAPLAHTHPAGDTIFRQIRYVDMELPQDVCAAGRVQRLGIESQPSLTTAQAPFVTGLSATGRLVSAVRAQSFYGQPLVAWTPALDANVYEVQWSKTRYPFVAEADPSTGDKGTLTAATSTVLPLGAGTWWYRVRGFDYNLPSGVQQMSWSAPQRIVVAPPTFKVSKAAKATPKFKVVGGKK
jgi:hypothetical protein